MEKIDLKDQKILYQLDIDSRKSFRSIGKIVGLSKDIVASRVRKLTEKGIIKNFYTVINPLKIGFISVRFTILLQNTTPEIEDEIINYFVKNKYSAWVASAKGRFDLSVIMWIKDMSEFRIFWRKTLHRYRDFFQREVFSIFFQTTSYHQSFLLEDSYDIKDREQCFITGIEKKVEIDDIDFQILKSLSENARISSVELGNKLNLSAMTISNRIKKLKDSNIIKGFRVNIDFSKLGYKYYKVDINIRKFNSRNKIISYVELNPYLVYLDETAGSSDLELSFIVKNENHFHEIMKDVIKKFPDTILNYQYYYVNKSHKLLFLPDE